MTADDVVAWVEAQQPPQWTTTPPTVPGVYVSYLDDIYDAWLLDNAELCEQQGWVDGIQWYGPIEAPR